MALIVEDGTGLANAESYISVADTNTRMAALGNTNWEDLLTAEREAALRRATNYMVQAYRLRWHGMRVTSTQALDWPRLWVMVDGYAVASTIVPEDVANACADLAFKAASGDLAEDITRAVVREKIGPLETEYSAHSPQAVFYRSIDMALAPYIKGSSGGGGGNVLLTRA